MASRRDRARRDAKQLRVEVASGLFRRSRSGFEYPGRATLWPETACTSELGPPQAVPHARSPGVSGDRPYHTRVEQRLTDDGSSRADIAINGHDFTILIEVKIDAPESGDQIKRYLDHLAALPGGKRALIFLTPQGRPVKDEKLKGSVSYLSWSEVADVLDTHINREPGLARQPAGLLLSHFAEHIRGHARQRRKKQ